MLADLLWFGLSDQPHFSLGPRQCCRARHLRNGEARRRTARRFALCLSIHDADFIKPNLNEIAGVDDIYGYDALVPRQYADLLPVSVFELPHWPELMANNAILSLLNTRFILAEGDQAKALEDRFLHSPPPSPTERKSAWHRRILYPPAAGSL